MAQSATPHGATAAARPAPSANGKRILLVLDMDVLADEQFGLEPINYLVSRQSQSPSEVVVLSLVSTRQARMPSMELLLGAGSGVAPRASRPHYDVSAAAERRMDLAVQHLQAIGYQAGGLISDEDLVQAVNSETRDHEYDEVILATGQEGGRWLARSLRLDPVRQLRRRLGQRLIIFPPQRPAQKTAT